VGRNAEKRRAKREERDATTRRLRQASHARAAVSGGHDEVPLAPWWADSLYYDEGWEDGPNPTLSAALFRVSALLVSTGFTASVEDTLAAVAGDLRTLLGADTLSLHRLDHEADLDDEHDDAEDATRLERVAASHELPSDEGLLSFSSDDALVSAVLSGEQSVRVDDAARDERVTGVHGQRTHVGSLILAPLSFDDERAGVLCATRKEVRAFGDDDEGRVRLVASSLSQDLRQARLLKAALLDPDTRLSSRMALLEALPREIERARRYNTPLSIVMLHIDGLRDIVGDYGRAVAREIMSEVGRRLPLVVRRADLTVRFGADVFLVLSPSDAEVAAGAAERLVEAATGEPFSAGDVRIDLAVSASAATLEDEDEDALAFLLRAEASLPLQVVSKGRRG
jgi:diguanylate cyclase (GGDEF)-like protein